MSITVGEAARRAHLTPKAVRLYEACGLLAPVARSTSGYRLYTDDDVRLLQFIARVRALGLGLETIRELIELRRDGTPPSRQVLGILHRHLGQIDNQLADLAQLRSSLSAVFEEAKQAAHRDGDVRLCEILRSDTTPVTR
jgi:MerR family copper efflux transcriptional regulator